MTVRQLEFGFYPGALGLRVGPIVVKPLPDLEAKVSAIATDGGVKGDWIYAPPQKVHVFGMAAGVQTMPYPSRLFGLPKTHVLEHAAPDSEDHLKFHLWTLSLFTGLRLTSAELGFVDATPIQPGKLMDFVLMGRSLMRAVELAETFWVGNRSEPLRARRFAAAVHAFLLGQNLRYLQFEQFMLLYTALDACFALAKALHPTKAPATHSERVAWMCGLFGMPTPAWADSAAEGGSDVAILRNATIHEALFMDQPLGFAVHGVGTNQNLPLEMQGLICRFLVALIGGPDSTYVRSPVNTRQRYGLELK